jgi:hypothetical protein
MIFWVILKKESSIISVLIFLTEKERNKIKREEREEKNKDNEKTEVKIKAPAKSSGLFSLFSYLVLNVKVVFKFILVLYSQ